MNLLSRHKTLLISLGLLLIFSIFSLYWLLFRPPSGTSLTKVVTIKRGMNLKKISTIFEQEGIIRNRHFFIGLATLLGKKADIKAGEYEFHTRMLPLEVLDALVTGQVKRHLVTIAEGLTLSQIAQYLGDLNIVGKEAFLQTASSPALIATLGLSHSDEGGKISTLEGYLFPDTYYVKVNSSPVEVIGRMTGRFQTVFNDSLKARAKKIGMTENEVVILASIIECETAYDDERPFVSQVFHRRLKMGLPLAANPTIQYAIGQKRRVLNEDLTIASPYNTYIHPGLPPGPVSNPGEKSLRAALYPADTSYLYFVADGKGGHVFSRTLSEHSRAVQQYKRQRKKSSIR